MYGRDPEDAPPSAEDDETPVDEAAVAAFGEWYESQAAEWIEFMDALGRKGPVGSRP